MERTESGAAGVADPGGTVRVLYVDGDPGVLDATADALERAVDRLAVATESDAEAALARLGEERFDCVVSGHRTGGTDGVEFLAAARDLRPTLPLILFTGESDEGVAVEAIRAGVTDYVRKDEDGEGHATLADRVVEAVEEHRAERAVAETERRSATLLEHSRDAIVVLDEAGVFRYASPGISPTTGYDPEDLVGEDAFSYIHPADRSAVREQFEAGLTNADTDAGRIEYRFLGADGEYRWFESIGSSEFEATVGGYVITSREITERKQRERELEQYETMMQTIPDGVILLDDHGEMIRVNEAWADIVGYPREQLEGEPFQRLVEDGVVDEAIVDRYIELVTELLKSGSDEKGTFTATVVPPDDDREHVYEAHFALLPFEERFGGTAGVVRDVTEKIRRRRELERQNERLEKFASVVSHDLRNPLDIAMSRAEIIRDEHGIDRAGELVETLDAMADLIDDVLALARQGRVVDDPDPVDLEAVVDDAADTVGVDERGADLRVVDDLPTVAGDPKRLRALFENLLANAVEHGAPGDPAETGSARGDPTGDENGHDREGVTIRVGTTDGSGADPDSRGGFYVADDGSGIPPADREQVFDVGFTTAEDGTGFGLNIVREIVQAHDWTIEATEAEAGGARFEVTGVGVLDDGAAGESAE